MKEGILSLKWNNHNSTFIHTLSTLHKMEMYSDVTLACEGKYFSVHKLVLSICSEYFEEILSQTKCQHPVVVLKDIKHNNLEALLNYMYAGEANVAQSELANLIKAAECLRIKGLADPDETPPVREKRRHLESSESPQYCKKRRSEEAIDSTNQTVKEYGSSGNRLLDGSKSTWKHDPSQIFGNERQNSEIILDRDSNKWIPEIVLKGEPIEVKQEVAELKIEEQEDTHQNLDNSNLQLDYNMNLGGDESNESGRHGQDSQTSHIIQGLMAHSLPGPSGVQGVDISQDGVHDAISRQEPLFPVTVPSHSDEDVSSWCDDSGDPDNDSIEQKSEEEDQALDNDPEDIYVRQSQHKVNKRDYGKVQYCVFCFKGFTNLSKHFFNSHPREQSIMKIEMLPVNSVERKYKLESIRNRGNYHHNCAVLSEGKGEIIPYKCPPTVEHYTEYVPCQHCLGFFKKKDLWKHDKICHQRKRLPCETKYKRLVQLSSMLLPSNNSALSEKVLSKMKLDDINLIARNDPLIITFGERLYKIFGHLPNRYSYISQKMRELCRLLKSSREVDRDVTSLSDLINPSKIPTLIKALHAVCKFEQSHKYGIPPLALKIGHSLKKCAIIQKSIALQKDLNEQREKCDKFIEVLTMDWEHAMSWSLTSLREGI